MDRDRKRRRRLIKLFITEFLMVISIVTIVGLLMFIVSGYRVNDDFEISQGGMVQFVSTPAGAHVTIDGERVSGRTEFSRMVDAGEHDIVISRDGYDTWSRKVEVRPGYLLRLTYPRLFKTERVAEETMDLPKLKWLSASPNRELLLYATDTTTKWTMANIRGDNIVTTTLDVNGIFSGTDKGKFPGEIVEMRWNKNGDKILLKVKNGKKVEWGLVNTRKVTNSVNLSKEFDMDFSGVEFMDDSAEWLFVIAGGNLRQVDVSGKKISKVLVSGVSKVAADGREAIFVSEPAKDKTRKVGLIRDNENGSVNVATITAENVDAVVNVAIMDYLGDNYLVYTVDEQVMILKTRDLPKYGERLDAKTVEATDLGFVPSVVEASRGKEYVVFRRGKKMAAFEAETEKVMTYTALSPRMRWLDDSLLYDAIADEEGVERLVVWDFNGENVRWLSGVDGDFDVAITANNRWLYYVKGGKLYRERLM